MCQSHNVGAHPSPPRSPGPASSLPPFLPPGAVSPWGSAVPPGGAGGPGLRSPPAAPPAAPSPSAWRAGTAPPRGRCPATRGAAGARCHWLCRRHVTRGAWRGVRQLLGLWDRPAPSSSCPQDEPAVLLPCPLCVPVLSQLCPLPVPALLPLFLRSLYCSVPFMSPLRPLNVLTPSLQRPCCCLTVSLLCPRSVLA